LVVVAELAEAGRDGGPISDGTMRARTGRVGRLGGRVLAPSAVSSGTSRPWRSTNQTISVSVTRGRPFSGM
jgi:hypothetical protein